MSTGRDQMSHWTAEIPGKNKIWCHRCDAPRPREHVKLEPAVLDNGVAFIYVCRELEDG